MVDRPDLSAAKDNKVGYNIGEHAIEGAFTSPLDREIKVHKKR